MGIITAVKSLANMNFKGTHLQHGHLRHDDRHAYFSTVTKVTDTVLPLNMVT